ncbi:MAG TPA: imidazole glycerol phosphate synthase subunit HisH [Caulobacteraceae bacterium]|nr:imidazole glycerol phosphate synthase subunit HisH [Caulobacteraceae bacterium]
MTRVALIDYGSGNLRSAEKALRHVASGMARTPEVATTSDPRIIAAADAVVLPGVGAFSACATAVSAREGVREAMEMAVRRRGAPFLGICVGMQLMATRGLEFGETAGFDWIAGDVAPLPIEPPRIKAPHVGWNAVAFAPDCPLFAGLGPDVDMYFTHSFAFAPTTENSIAARTDHGGLFVSAVRRDNLAGVQFHPEKSQAAGLTLLANFLGWRP